MKFRPILLIEDTSSLQTLYGNILKGAGYDVTITGSLAGARAALAQEPAEIVLLDLALPDGDGMELLAEVLKSAPSTRFIVITANGSVDRVVEAMRAGAFDFLLKPIDEQSLLNTIMNARAEIRRSRSLEDSSKTPSGPLGGFIGSSQAMEKVYAHIRSVAGSMASVFITGESGTGKEIAAEAIHALSNRSDGPFVPINCRAIPAGYLESEVFGHAEGAFPGARSAKPGAAALADGGTLFLDEVCEMDLGMQARFLRFLQTSTVHPMGNSEAKQINVRIICATSRDPHEEMRAGRLRADLYYRLHVVPLHLPELRNRGHDVIEIAEAVLQRLSRREGRAFTGLSDEVKELFLRHSWPGNVRQLTNVLWNVVVLGDGPVVTREALPADLLAQIAAAHPAEDIAEAPGAAEMAPQPDGMISAGTPQDAVALLVGTPLGEIERMVIEATIAAADGSVPQAARILDVSPSTLYRKLESWGRPARKRDEKT